MSELTTHLFSFMRLDFSSFSLPATRHILFSLSFVEQYHGAFGIDLAFVIWILEFLLDQFVQRILDNTLSPCLFKLRDDLSHQALFDHRLDGNPMRFR